MRVGTLGLVMLLLLSAAAADSNIDSRVEQILESTPLIDGHNDFPRFRERFKEGGKPFDFNTDLSSLDNPPHTDLPRLLRGGVGAQFWVAWVPIEEHGGAAGDTKRFLRRMDFVYELVEANPEHLEMAFSSTDIVRIMESNRIASLIGIEGGHAIEDSLPTLRMLYRAGARYMTLTHSKGLRWVDSSQDEERVGGLTPFGRAVVREMNRLGMMVDLSHVSVQSMHAVLDESTAPVIFSHSSINGVTKDTGSGMPDEVLAHVFDPFFTTKRVGEGTGLGLSLAHGFVKQSNGVVTIDSSDAGTTVRLLLPSERSSTTARDAEPDAPALLPQLERSEENAPTVLLVEDEEPLRELLARRLHLAGYQSIQVENGSRALEVLRSKRHIDVVLTDLRLPGSLSGHDVVRHAHEDSRALPAICMTGYSEEALGPDGFETVQLLVKPFSFDALEGALREALGRQPQA